MKYKISKYLYNIYTKDNKLSEAETLAVQLFKLLLSKAESELIYIPNSNKKFIKWGKYTAFIDNPQLTIISKTQYFSITLPLRVIEKLTEKFNQKLDKSQFKIDEEIDLTVVGRLTTLIDDVKN